MILPFSTEMNGKPTHFIDKIWSGLIYKKLSTIRICRDFERQRALITPSQFGVVPYHHPKLHTIREDKNNRWKVGTKIDFFINARQKNMFRFAPVLPVVSTQVFEINWHSSNEKLFVRVYIDGKSFARIDFDKELYVSGQMLDFVNSDGFDTIEDFFDYFDKDYVGKIIHWTDLEY